MSKPLAHFKKGNRVWISCYKPGCGDVSIPVTLGEKHEIHPSFIHGGGVGRLHWRRNAAAKGFALGESLGGSGYRHCTGCGTLFGSVIVISNGLEKKATVFGYDPEPA